MQETKEKLQMEQGKLKEQSEYVQSPYYLEKVARDELSMAKIGETVVIIPDRSEEIRSEKGELKSELQKPNWQKWWEVLSGIE
jgi:hypothetical protein